MLASMVRSACEKVVLRVGDWWAAAVASGTRRGLGDAGIQPGLARAGYACGAAAAPTPGGGGGAVRGGRADGQARPPARRGGTAAPLTDPWPPARARPQAARLGAGRVWHLPADCPLAARTGTGPGASGMGGQSETPTTPRGRRRPRYPATAPRHSPRDEGHAIAGWWRPESLLPITAIDTSDRRPLAVSPSGGAAAPDVRTIT